MSKRSTSNIIIAFALVLVVLVFGLLVRNATPQSEVEPNCYVGQTEAMTIQEVANLLDISLVELTWLPDNLNVIPRLTTYHAYYQGRAKCRVRIDYSDRSSSSVQLVEINVGDLQPIPSTRIPPSCDWRFIPNESLTSLGTNCTAGVDSGTQTLDIRINLSAEFLPEDAQRIINGMRIVDPSG